MPNELPLIPEDSPFFIKIQGVWFFQLIGEGGHVYDDCAVKALTGNLRHLAACVAAQYFIRAYEVLSEKWMAAYDEGDDAKESDISEHRTGLFRVSEAWADWGRH